MRIGIIAARGASVENIGDFLPDDAITIVTGGELGVARAAREYARDNFIPRRLYPTEYEKYGSSAPLKRDMKIIDHSDVVFAFWDCREKRILHALTYCARSGVPFCLLVPPAKGGGAAP